MSKLPDGWAEVPLLTLAGPDGLMSDGDWVETKDQDEAGGIRLTQLADVGDGFFRDRSARFINEEAARRLNVTYLRKGDVLIARMPDPLGRACIFPGLSQPAVTAVDVMIARIDGSLAEPGWIAHVINSPEVRSALADQAGGTTRQRVAGGKLKEFVLPMPPIPEQRRIVAKVDGSRLRTARARAELDRIPALVAHYKNTLLSAAFSGDLTAHWRSAHRLPDPEELRIDQIGKVITGMTPSTKERERFFGGEVPFLKPTDLDAGYRVSLAREFLTPDGALASRTAPAGSTLVTCIGTIGKAGLARVACAFNQQINAIVPKQPQIIPEWLFWMVCAPEFQRLMVDNSSATTIAIINKGRFEKLSLPTPHPDEQAEIVRRIEVAFSWLDRMAADHAATTRLLPRLDAAILAKAFRGELVPQDPSDEPAATTLARVAAARTAAPVARRGRRARAN